MLLRNQQFIQLAPIFLWKTLKSDPVKPLSLQNTTPTESKQRNKATKNCSSGFFDDFYASFVKSHLQ
jgi:hypothetical protein